MLASFVDRFVPARCLACRRLTEHKGPLCVGCRAEICWIEDACPRCALPGHAGRGCPAVLWDFDLAWAAVAYGGPVPALVRAVKDRAARPALELMAAAIVARAPEEMLDRSVTLIPVPADQWRSRRRGTDHALLLADAVAARSGQAVLSALTRSHTSRQAGSSRSRRLGREMGMATRAGPPPDRVVLVDDVHTTGATLGAAAKALRHEGTGQIAAMTFGRSI